MPREQLKLNLIQKRKGWLEKERDGLQFATEEPKKKENEVQNGAVKGVANWDDFEAFLELSDEEKPPPQQEAEHNFFLYGDPPGWGSMTTEHFDEYFPVPLSQTKTIGGGGEEAAAFCRVVPNGGFSDDCDGDGGKKKEEEVSLNLNLNYEEVLEAWSGSGRGSLWAAGDSSLSNLANGVYMGEVPRMEEERTRRVLRYKEKRHNRLFSKKIRYQVRKLNADKRPRIKYSELFLGPSLWWTYTPIWPLKIRSELTN